MASRRRRYRSRWRRREAPVRMASASQKARDAIALRRSFKKKRRYKIFPATAKVKIINFHLVFVFVLAFESAKLPYRILSFNSRSGKFALVREQERINSFSSNGVQTETDPRGERSQIFREPDAGVTRRRHCLRRLAVGQRMPNCEHTRGR